MVIAMRNLFAGVSLAALGVSAGAVTLTPLTYSVYFDGDYPRCCEIISNKVELVSSFNDEKEYGFAEFDLTGAKSSVSPVYLSITIASAYDSSQYLGEGEGQLTIDAFAGSGQENRLNVGAASLGPIIGYSEDMFLPGSTFVLNVSQLYNIALYNNDSYFGVRFKIQGADYAVVGETFSGVTLSGPGVAAPVPEPSDAWMLLAGLPLLAMRRQRDWRGYKK